jgi:integrase
MELEMDTETETDSDSDTETDLAPEMEMETGMEAGILKTKYMEYIKTVLKNYLKQTQLSPSTISGYNRIIINSEGITVDKWQSKYTSLMVEKGCLNSTIKTDILMIAAAMRFAGHEVNINYKSLPECKSEKAYLKKHELIEIYNLDLGEHNCIKDMLVFQAFTGLRWSDVVNATIENVKDGEIPYLQYVPKKTRNLVKVDLGEIPYSIIKRYKSFPDVKSQMASYVLKKAAKGVVSGEIHSVFFSGKKRIEVTKPRYKALSSHSMRHTYAYLKKMSGAPSHLIASNMGISVETLYNNYYHVDADDNLKESVKYLI